MAVSDIMAGPVTIYYAPVGEAIPDESTVAWGAAWGGNWETIGYTKAPLSANYEPEFLDIGIEQALANVRAFKSGEAFMLETTIADMVADNLGVLMSSDVVTTASGVGQVGFDQIDVGGDFTVDEYAWGFEGLHAPNNTDRFPVRFFIHKGVARLSGALEFSKSDYVGTPIQISALEDLDRTLGQRLFTFQKVTAAAS